MTKREQHEASAMRQATEAFAKHQIVEYSVHDNLGRWLLKAPDRTAVNNVEFTGIFWVEVVELRGGHLLVHGDIRPALFSMYEVSGGPGRYVRWMDRSAPSDSYLREKAHGGATKVVEYVAEIAKEDARAWLSDHDEDELASLERAYKRLVPHAHDSFSAAFEDACRRVGHGDETSKQDAFDLWSGVLNDSETWYDWGMVTDRNFAFAWAALRKLNRLLDGLI